MGVHVGPKYLDGLLARIVELESRGRLVIDRANDLIISLQTPDEAVAAFDEAADAFTAAIRRDDPPKGDLASEGVLE